MSRGGKGEPPGTHLGAESLEGRRLHSSVSASPPARAAARELWEERAVGGQGAAGR